jgi:uncharacterized protein (TIGR03067 family)
MLFAADQGPDEAKRKDLEKMQGEWQAASYVVDGMQLPDDDAQALFRTVKGEQYTVFRFSKPIGKGTFTIDATKKPKTIDSQPAQPNVKPILGIYELDRDTLKVCNARPGQERPQEFASKPGSGHTLTVWQREKK